MKKTAKIFMFLFVILMMAMPAFAVCEIPGSCAAEIEGSAFAKDGFKSTGDNTVGAKGEFIGEAHYSAKGTTEASGSADSNGNIAVDSVKSANAFSSTSNSTLDNKANAEGIIGPGVVSEKGTSSNATWGIIGDNANYALGNEKNTSKEDGTKNVSNGPASISAKVTTDGKTVGTLTQGPNFRQSDISSSGNSNANGSNTFGNTVSGDGSIGAGSTFNKGNSSGSAFVDGSWNYSGNALGDGAGTGKTKVEITETTKTLGVKSHSEGKITTKAIQFD